MHLFLSLWHKKKKVMIQGVSHWNVRFEMVLRGRRINNFADFSLNACSAAMGIWVSSINFYINDTGCPPQPQVWRLPKLKKAQKCSKYLETFFSIYVHIKIIQSVWAVTRLFFIMTTLVLLTSPFRQRFFARPSLFVIISIQRWTRYTGGSKNE